MGWIDGVRKWIGRVGVELVVRGLGYGLELE